jgi:hypothetical protein
MNRADSAHDVLIAECSVFCRYLTGQAPSEYVLTCYGDAAPSTSGFAQEPLPLIDRGLLGLARKGRLPARIADSYARIFRPHSLLRRRLILVLAILENSPHTAAELNSALEGSRAAITARIGLTLLASAACLSIGIVLLGPLHLVTLLGGGLR